MNALEVKAKLRELAEQELGLLPGTHLDKLHKAVQTAEQALEKEKLWKVVQNLESKAASGNKKLFDNFRKAKGIQRPKKSALPGEVSAYATAMQKLLDDCKEEYEKKRKQLEEIAKKPPEEAAEALASLDPDSRAIMTEVAGLTKRTARGSTAMKLSDKPKSNLNWLKEYKKQKNVSTILDG